MKGVLLLSLVCLTWMPSCDSQKPGLVADVMFLVDGSSDVSDGSFKKMKDIINGITNNLAIGVRKIRLGISQFSDNVSDGIPLNANQYQTRAQVLNYVKGGLLKKGGLRQTGKALQHSLRVLSQEFTASRREMGIPQYLVILTAGESQDTIDVTRIEELGVKIITLEFQGHHTGELYEKSHSHVNVQSDSRVAELSADIANLIKNEIQNPLAFGRALKSCDKIRVADIVFFVHYSDDIEDKNFIQIKDFLYKIINSLDFDQSGAEIRVGLAFVRPQKGSFSLTTYTNKGDILKSVEALRRRETNQGPLKQELRNFMLDAMHHFKPKIEVPQIAVLLTDDIGTSSLQNAALDLYLAGVTVFTVSVRVNQSMLFDLASYVPEDKALSVDSYQQLIPLQQKLLDKICDLLRNKDINYWRESKEVAKSCSKLMKADIYFLIDGSGSVDPKQFDKMKVFVNDTVQFFTIRPNGVRFGVVQYSSGQSNEVLIGRYNNKRDLKCGVHSIVQEMRETDLVAGIKHMTDLFVKAKRENIPQYLIVLMEGKREVHQQRDPLIEPLKKLKDLKIEIYSIGNDSDQLLEVASSRDKFFRLRNFAFLQDIQLQLARNICESAALYSTEADVVFLIDSSSSTSLSEYNSIKNFMKDFVKSVKVGKNHVQVAVMQYSNTVRTVFQLDEFHTSESLQQAIDGMKRMHGSTMTGNALRSVGELFRRSTDKTEKVLVLLTDDRAHDDVTQPASVLRNSGIDIYAIGAARADISQLQDITGSQSKIIALKNYDSLTTNWTLVEKLRNTLQMECQNIEIADIVFVVDVTWNVESDKLKILKDFMISLVENFDIGPNNVRIGVILYGDVPQEAFDLWKHQDLDSLRDAIEKLDVNLVTHNPKNTAAAIRFSKNIFSEDKGGRGRRGVPQFLIAVMDGDSNDANQLRAVCDDVRASGINTLAVGINYNRMEDLRVIGGSQDRYFAVDSYQRLKYLTRRLTQEICNVPYCNTTLVDVVFLIDGSESISNAAFTKEKDFIRDTVKNFDANDNVRIGLAQFSSTYEEYFKLRSFIPMSDFYKKLDGVQQLISGTRLADALQKARSFFTQDQMRHDVVPRLVLLTDGEDRNAGDAAVAENARVLRDVYKVNIIVVAVGDDNTIDPVRLNRIAGTKSNVIRAESHKALEIIRPRIVRALCDSPLCNETIPPPPPTTPPNPSPTPPSECWIDVAVGIDVTGKPGEPLLFYHSQLRENLLPALRAIAAVQLNACTSGFLVRFGFHVINTDQPYDTPFRTLQEDLMEELSRRTVRQPSAFDREYLLSFAGKFRRDSDSRTRKQVILIFTDGVDDNLDELEAASNSLREDGVDGLLTVALENTPKEAIQMLRKVEFGPFGSWFCCRAQILAGEAMANNLRSAFVTFSEEVCCKCCMCVGPPGPKGNPGRPGEKGSPGRVGVPGHGGEDGPPGRSGGPGEKGLAGYKGCSGPRGAKGVVGSSGEKGDTGEEGWDGVPGQLGSYGIPGSKGMKGDFGNQGERGPPGHPGESGQKGLPGDPGSPGSDAITAGPKGDRGAIGPEGDPGVDGLKGAEGDPGSKGRDGRRGRPGTKGSEGEGGVDGLSGEKGPSGLQGLRGPPGYNGQQGEPGIKGPQGPLGPPGTMGSKGNPGQRGQKGQVGDPGSKGALGDVGFRGQPGSDGEDGYGEQGIKGAKGAMGNYGRAGARGEAGEKGASGGGGVKGNRGTSGVSGPKGEPGESGEPGHDGRKGPKGLPGAPEQTDCDLIHYIRGNCVCQGCRDCPTFPLELLFAVDTSNQMEEAQFSDAKELVSHIVNSTTISEGGCPKGARVAVANFSSAVDTLIRFPDYHSKNMLLELVRTRMVLAAGGGRQDLGGAMRHAARHVFKRTRGGKNVGKMAIFLTGNLRQSQPPRHAEALFTAAMELYANDIIPVIITSGPVPNEIRDVFRDFPGRYEFIPDLTNTAEITDRLKLCFFCYDSCDPDQRCDAQRPHPPRGDMDVVFLLDGSRGVSALEFEKARHFLSAAVDWFSQPPTYGEPTPFTAETRLALVQQRGVPPRGEDPVRVEFDFQRYSSDRAAVKRHIRQSLRQLQGSSALGRALEYITGSLFTKEPRPGSTKVIFTILGGANDPRDQKRLSEAALQAKCNGYILFTLALGKEVLDREIELLSSPPVSAHSSQLGRVVAPNVEYALRFAQTFFKLLPKRPYSNPNWNLGDRCDLLKSGDGFQSDGVLMENKTKPYWDASEVLAIAGTAAENNPHGPQMERPQVTEVTNPQTVRPPTGSVSGDYGGKRVSALATPTAARCRLSRDNGQACRGFQGVKWFYRRLTNRCSVFWYGGCGGNGNRFATQAECLRQCAVPGTL